MLKIDGEIMYVSEMVTKQSKTGVNYSIGTFILMPIDPTLTKIINFTYFNDFINKFFIYNKEIKLVTVTFRIESKEYQSKYITDCIATDIAEYKGLNQ